METKKASENVTSRGKRGGRAESQMQKHEKEEEELGGEVNGKNGKRS